jgi:hypothetical protein
MFSSKKLEVRKISLGQNLATQLLLLILRMAKHSYVPTRYPYMNGLSFRPEESSKVELKALI